MREINKTKTKKHSKFNNILSFFFLFLFAIALLEFERFKRLNWNEELTKKEKKRKERRKCERNKQSSRKHQYMSAFFWSFWRDRLVRSCVYTFSFERSLYLFETKRFCVILNHRPTFVWRSHVSNGRRKRRHEVIRNKYRDRRPQPFFYDHRARSLFDVEPIQSKNTCECGERRKERTKADTKWM